MKGSPVNEEPVVLDITGEAELTAQKDLIHDVLSKADDGGLSWDPDHKTVVVRLVGPVDGSSPAIEQVKADVLSAAKGLTDKGFTVEFRSVKYSRDELEQLATRLFDTMDVWAPGLKPAIGGGWDPEMNRVDVAVRLDTGQASAWIERLRALNDDRITFHTFTPVGDGWGSRITDFAPWTTGAWLSFDPGLIATTTNADCTLGFTWRKWTTNVLYGGTANHCTGGGAWATWYGNTNKVGTAAFTSPASDGMLLGGSTYSPTAWVGSAGTTDIRDVRAIDTSWDPGDYVAISGAISGLRTARVQATHYLDPCKNLHVTLMNQWVTAGGDSGGPWLTTMGPNSAHPGDVVAHGQHVGRGCDANKNPVLGSEFMPLNTISMALSASIYVTP